MGQQRRTWSSVFWSSICHYCGEYANTQDHIVPRSLLWKPQARLPYWFRSHNIVPACSECNGAKAAFRSDCICEQCTWAWNAARGAGFLTGEIPPVKQILRAPAA